MLWLKRFNLHVKNTNCLSYLHPINVFIHPFSRSQSPVWSSLVGSPKRKILRTLSNNQEGRRRRRQIRRKRRREIRRKVEKAREKERREIRRIREKMEKERKRERAGETKARNKIQVQEKHLKQSESEKLAQLRSPCLKTLVLPRRKRLRKRMNVAGLRSPRSDLRLLKLPQENKRLKRRRVRR